MINKNLRVLYEGSEKFSIGFHGMNITKNDIFEEYIKKIIREKSFKSLARFYERNTIKNLQFQ